MPELANPNDDIKVALQEIATQTGQDHFAVKIFRRMMQGSPETFIAAFDQVTLDKINNAELWLGPLAGGGPQFAMQVFHNSNRNKVVGGKLIFNITGAVHDVNPAIITTPGWDGPTMMTSPKPMAAAPVSAIPTYAFSPAGAPQVLSPGQPPTVPAGVPAGGITGEWFALRAQMEQQMRSMEVERLERQAKDREEAAERRANEAIQLARAEAQRARDEIQRLKEQMNAPRPESSGGMKDVINTAMPLLMALFKESADARREQAAAIQASNERMVSLIVSANNRPSIDPEVKALLLDRNRGPDSSAIAETADAMTRMASNAVRMATALADSKGGDSTEMVMLQEMRKAIESLGRAFRPSGAGAFTGYQPPNVNGNGAPPRPQQPAGATARGPQVPPPGSGTARQVKLDWNDPKIPLVDRLVDKIRWLEDAQTVVGEFIAAVLAREPSVAAALKATPDMDPTKLLEMRLGSNWPAENPTYAMHLGEEFEKQAVAAGLIPQPVEEEEPMGGEFEEEEEEDAEIVEE